jgi:serine/threonine-protein kinase RsbW
MGAAAEKSGLSTGGASWGRLPATGAGARHAMVLSRSADVGTPPEWRSWPAVAEAVTMARRALARFAQAAGAGEDLVQRVRLAVSEAVTNAVVHAYRDRQDRRLDPPLVHVGAAIAGDGKVDELWILVADEGCGLRPRDDSPGAGQGLRLIAATVDELTILERAEGGTELRMRFDLDADADAAGAHSLAPEEKVPAVTDACL